MAYRIQEFGTMTLKATAFIGTIMAARAVGEQPPSRLSKGQTQLFTASFLVAQSAGKWDLARHEAAAALADLTSRGFLVPDGTYFGKDQEIYGPTIALFDLLRKAAPQAQTPDHSSANG